MISAERKNSLLQSEDPERAGSQEEDVRQVSRDDWRKRLSASSRQAHLRKPSGFHDTDEEGVEIDPVRGVETGENDVPSLDAVIEDPGEVSLVDSPWEAV